MEWSRYRRGRLVTTAELLQIRYSLERVMSGEPDDNQLDVWWVELRRGTLEGDEDIARDEIANATLYGMDPYRNSLLGEAPFDVADAYSADTAYYYVSFVPRPRTHGSSGRWASPRFATGSGCSTSPRATR